MSRHSSGLTTVVLAGVLTALTMQQARASLVVTQLNDPVTDAPGIYAPDGLVAAEFTYWPLGPVLLDVLELRGSGMIGTSGSPTLLAAGTTVGPSSSFETQSGDYEHYPSAIFVDGFFGVRSENGYYGYIEDDNDVLIDAVFQSAPGVAITTASYVASPVPEPSSLALLSVGVTGVAAAFRRHAKREEVATGKT